MKPVQAGAHNKVHDRHYIAVGVLEHIGAPAFGFVNKRLQYRDNMFREVLVRQHGPFGGGVIASDEDNIGPGFHAILDIFNIVVP